MLAEVQALVYLVKTIVSTPTNPPSKSQLDLLVNRALPLALWNYLLSLTGRRGFFFYFAMGGAQLKEATIEIQGHDLSVRNSHINFFKKEL